MNKLKIFFIAAVLVFMSGSAMSQQKSGYISLDQVLAIMPEVAKIDSQMQRYQQDSLNLEYVNMFEQYNYYDSLLTKTDTAKMPAAVLRQYRIDRDNFAFQIQNWQTLASNMYQQKQGTLLQPVYNKVMTAIRAVAKEKGYTHVYDKQVMIVAPDGDDLLAAVAAKLKLQVPPNMSGLR
jgi:outer membrane protein